MQSDRAAKALRAIADFLAHVGLNGADLKDREIALALEQDARALVTQPDPVDEAREAFPAGSRVRVVGKHPQDGHDFLGRVGVVSKNQDNPTGAALWVWFADGYDRATRVLCPVVYLAAEQAGREEGGSDDGKA